MLSQRKAGFLAGFTLAFVLILTSPVWASDTEWVYRWPENSGGNLEIDNDTGVFQYLEARYDSRTSEFSFEFQLSPLPAFPERLARGFALIISSGNYPHSDGAEFAVFYFDATDMSNPKLVAYPFNAYDQSYDSFSFRDARFFQSGIQLPDKLCTSLDPSSCLGWVQSISSSDDASGNRTFQFKIDTGIINNYSLTWPNPSGKSWEGAQFQNAFGIWLIPHGHPDLAYTYGADGFIEDVNFGAEFLGQEYLGFFDGSLLPTTQDPFCESAPASYTLDVGEPFSKQVTGTSPDDDLLQVDYSGVPAGATVNPPAGYQQMGSITSTFEWTPQEEHAGNVYNVDVTFTEVESGVDAVCPFTLIVQDENVDCLGVPGGTAAIDICGVCEGDGTSCLDCLGQPFGTAEIDRCGVCEGNGLSCLGCSDFDISENLLDLDGNGEKQAFVVAKLLKKYVRLTAGTELEEQARVYRERIIEQTNELRFQNWNITWSVPQIVTNCANAEFCVSVDRAPTFDQYLVNSQELFRFAKKAARKVRRVGGNPGRLLKRGRRLTAANVTLVESTPLVTDICS